MGVIMGTAAYMSPEQVRGKPVDKRADIWAFGVVLFEMLTGQRVFSGETVSETLAAVMMKEPEWDWSPADLSSKLSNLIRRCLQKDPRQRVRDIGDVSLAMEGAFETPGPIPLPTEGARAQPGSWRQVAPLALGAFGVGVLITGIAMWSGMRPTLGSLARFVVVTPPGGPMSTASPGTSLTGGPSRGLHHTVPSGGGS